MADQELRDSSGKLLGRIKQLSNGKREGRDPTGLFKGTYDPKANETRTSNGTLVGRDDMLSNLVTDVKKK